MALTSGTKLGPYEILAPVGAGGMGEVYRARDPRLGREVAIKVLPDHLSSNPDALARFEREARAVAALSHPNILAIHDIGSDRGIAFVVTELLEGETLRARLQVGPLAWRKAAEIGAAIADGAAAAHSKDVVHRDLKPENIFLTSDGRVSILDFGLARIQPSARAEDQSGIPTETVAGTISGTPGYMSPEQVRGTPAGPPSDIFSLGCVLYEMVAGRRAFAAATLGETLAAILRDAPRPLLQTGKEIPEPLVRTIERCLEKLPGERFQSARDLAFALRSDVTVSAAPAPPPRRRAALGLVVAAVVVLAALVIGLNLGGLREQLAPGSRSSRIESLAVLPLENLSRNPEQEYFVDGMTEALIADLASIGSLRVISRTSVLPYKDKAARKQLPRIARDLKVDAVVEGSVMLVGDRVRITAQLIEAVTDRHLWAKSYERSLDDILALQREVAAAIAGEIRVKLTPENQARLGAAPRVERTTYDAYVRGRHFLNKRTEEDLRAAIRHFQQAIDADPTYAPAYTGLAECYNFLGYSNYLSPKESFPKSEAAAAKAQSLDPELADAYASIGYVRMYWNWNFPEAEKQFRRAIELNPNSATARHWYSIYLTAMRRWEEASREIERAQALDPLSVPITTDMGFELHYGGRQEEAIRQLRAALEMNPRFPLAHFWLGRVYTTLGRYDEALAALQSADATLREWQPMIAARGYLYGLSGKRKEAHQLLDELKARAEKGRFVSSYVVALIHTALGDKTQALAWLKRSYQERSHWLVWLGLDPRWDTLRSDQRFQDLLRRLTIPP